MQPLAAGDQLLELWTRAEESRHFGCPIEQVFEIVEHQEKVLGAEVRSYSLQRRTRITCTQLQRFGDGQGNHWGFGDLREVDPGDTVAEVSYQLARQPQGEPGFPNASRPRQRHEAHIFLLQQRSNGGGFSIPPDQS
jgi:hypothetical protein